MIIRIDFQLFIKIIAIKIIKIIKIIAIKIKITPQFLTSPLVHIQCRTQDVRNISREALVRTKCRPTRCSRYSSPSSTTQAPKAHIISSTTPCHRTRSLTALQQLK